MSSLGWYTVVVALVGLERLVELVVAKRNLAWSLSHGGREYGFSHYPVMVVLHTGLLAGSLVEAWLAPRPFYPALFGAMLVLVIATQSLRWWCIRTLGQQWNTRIVVVPGLERVTGGPYRFLPHPNYVAVVVEGVALPMMHTAWLTAGSFTVLNAVLLRVRIRLEDEALRVAYA